MKEFMIEKGPYLEEKKDTSNHIVIQGLLSMVAYRILKEGMIPYWEGSISFIQVFLPIFLFGATILLCYGCYYVGEHFLTEEREYTEEECLIDGILLGLLLPIHTPIFIILISVFSTVIIGRYFYSGKTLFVPSLIGIISSLGIVIWCSLCSIQTPSIIRLLFEYTEGVTLDSFSIFSIWTGLIGSWISKTSPILCVIILLFLIFQKAIKWRIPIYFIGCYLLLFVFQYFYFPITPIQIVKWLGVGNVLFLSIFVATDPRTTPVTTSGQILFALFLAIFTFYGNYLFSPFLSMILAILILNLMVPFLDYFGNYFRLKYCNEYIS